MVDYLTYLIDYSAEFITGVIISIISGSIYTTTSTGFMSRGKFRTKEAALVIYLATAFICGVLTPPIYMFSTMLVDNLNLISLMGFLLVVANFALHYEIKGWKQSSLKSLILYFIGFALIGVGIYLKLRGIDILRFLT